MDCIPILAHRCACSNFASFKNFKKAILKMINNDILVTYLTLFLSSARVRVTNVNLKGASGSALRPPEKSRAGRKSGDRALRDESVR
jgi:hypothetical protein